MTKRMHKDGAIIEVNEDAVEFYKTIGYEVVEAGHKPGFDPEAKVETRLKTPGLPVLEPELKSKGTKQVVNVPPGNPVPAESLPPYKFQPNGNPVAQVEPVIKPVVEPVVKTSVKAPAKTVAEPVRVAPVRVAPMLKKSK